MDVDLIIYDLDGTLIDSAQDITNAVNFMLSELKLPERSNEEVKGFIGEGIQHLVRCSLGKGHEDKLERGLKLAKKHYSAHLLDHTKLYPDVLEMLQQFRAKKQAVVTNKPEHFTLEVLKGLSIRHYFSSVIGGDTIRNKKPSPEGVLKVLGDLKVLPKRAIFVGDSHVDVETSRAAGIFSCAVKNGLGDQDALLMSRPDFVIERLKDLGSVLKN